MADVAYPRRWTDMQRTTAEIKRVRHEREGKRGPPPRPAVIKLSANSFPILAYRCACFTGKTTYARMHFTTGCTAKKRWIVVLHCSSTCSADWYALPMKGMLPGNDVTECHPTTGRDPRRLRHCVAHANRAFPNDSTVAPLAKVGHVLGGGALCKGCFLHLVGHVCHTYFHEHATVTLARMQYALRSSVHPARCPFSPDFRPKHVFDPVSGILADRLWLAKQKRVRCLCVSKCQE